MSDQELLDRAVDFAEFVSQCFSDSVEVVVHDVRGDLEHSAIAVFNNTVSGRQVGAPMTQLGAQFLTEQKYQNMKSVCNYQGVTANGKLVRASTFFVRNRQGKTIGCICANVDLTHYLDAAQVLDKLIRFSERDPSEFPEKGDGAQPRIQEDFSRSVTDSIGYIISEYTKQTDKKLVHFETDDKIAVVALMEKQGLFSFKGSIGEVAGILGISEPTLYRYLKKIKKMG
ncbi:MAG: PAS domain-containing protein [Peptococcaceae bacterium]|nr:PAS domain-containing protein [Peptococcaceae bacterium]